MRLSIEEQKKYLAENLEIEDLRRVDSNQYDIKSFVQATKGEHISDYLINKAWSDDNDRNTKVFLIRDKTTREIVFYFAINCGILFSELNTLDLEPQVKVPFDSYVEAIQKLKDTKLNEKEKENANNQLSESMESLWEAVGDADRVSRLLSLADEKVEILEEKREAYSKTEEADHVQPVQETFPAIDIKFLGRNNEYKPAVKLDFRIGVYVFWEMIVPHLLEVAEKVGCKYIYLFAADNSEKQMPELQAPPMWTPDYDPYDEESDEGGETREEEIYRLVNYYINELKFRYVSKYKILKPHYERTCFTLVQEVEALQKNRELVWQRHTEEDSDY